jgi:hypothetical protein
LSRAKGDVVEYPAVFPKSDFTLCTAVKIVEDYSGETALREAAEVVDVNDVGRGQCA